MTFFTIKYMCHIAVTPSKSLILPDINPTRPNLLPCPFTCVTKFGTFAVEIINNQYPFLYLDARIKAS
jgi:hypothetical protein